MSARALLLSGGPHPFEETTPLVAGLLEECDHEVTVLEDPQRAATALAEDPPELWVCNTLRWRMQAPKYDAVRAELAYETGEAVRRSFEEYVRGGGRLLALHAAPICFDDWEGWGEIVGARWDWDRSSHPPLGEIEVRVTAEHPLTAGVADFVVLDEAYARMDISADVEPLAVSRWEGEDHPVLWDRRVGEGRVVTCTLGHGRDSFEHPAHRRILRQAIEELAGP